MPMLLHVHLHVRMGMPHAHAPWRSDMGHALWPINPFSHTKNRDGGADALHVSPTYKNRDALAS